MRATLRHRERLLVGRLRASRPRGSSAGRRATHRRRVAVSASRKSASRAVRQAGGQRTGATEVVVGGRAVSAGRGQSDSCRAPYATRDRLTPRTTSPYEARVGRLDPCVQGAPAMVTPTGGGDSDRPSSTGPLGEDHLKIRGHAGRATGARGLKGAAHAGWELLDSGGTARRRWSPRAEPGTRPATAPLLSRRCRPAGRERRSVRGVCFCDGGRGSDSTR